MTAQSGFTYDGTGRLLVSDLVASAVPNTAVFENGFAFKAADGSLYVTSSAVSSPVNHSGLAFRPDGALYIVTTAATKFPKGGITTDANGAVLKDGVGAIANYQNGLPFTSAGAVATSA